MTGLKHKLAAFLTAMMALSGIGTALLAYGLAQHRADNAVINLAGAQRMLSQKMSKEAMLLAEGHGDAAAMLRQDRDRFDRVLTGLIMGDAELGIPAHPGEEVEAQVDAVMNLWKPFRADVDSLVASPAKDSRVDNIVAKNLELLNGMNQVVKLLETAANGKVDRITRMQFGLFGAVVLLVACGWLGLLAPLVRQLGTVVEEVTSASDAVCQAAKQVASSSQWLAETSTSQAAALEQTSSAAEQINATAMRCKDSSAAAAQVVAKSQHEFETASGTLEEVVCATTEIHESTHKIASVNKLIEGIAFQTNILALNAAVEAARAGEAGMGFSVVADEVRRLAQRSAEASRDTSTLVENSVAVVARGAAKVGKASEAMGVIQSDWEQVRGFATEIHTASQEQFAGISQIAQAVTMLQGNTQQTASVSEESAASALELKAQAESMQAVVTGLARIVNGR
jgi:methyl-accepting chemotaxis protein